MRGNTSIIFVFCAFIVLGASGLAVDRANISRKQNLLQNQVDSATLAAAKKLSDSRSRDEFDVNVVVKDVLKANDFDVDAATLEINETGGVITVTAAVQHKLIYGGLYGNANTTINVQSIAGGAKNKTYEIALVIDNTESMGFRGKMGALRIGLYDLVASIEEIDPDTRVAMIPFARYVNVGADKAGQIWLDTPASYDTERTWQQASRTGGSCTTEPRTIMKDGEPYTYDAEVCTGQTTTYETMRRNIRSEFEGCVGVRNNRRHVLDSEYTLERVPGLLNTQPHERTGKNRDVEAWCPRQITPLTSDFAALRYEIGELYPLDHTYIPLGLSWAERVLTTPKPFADTVADSEVEKVIILMSDGKNTVAIDDSEESRDDYTAPPYLKKLDDGVIATQADNDTLVMCSQLKGQGVKIFVIAFDIGDETTHQLLRSCASDEDTFYKADSNAELIETFRSLTDLFEGELRIIK